AFRPGDHTGRFSSANGGIRQVSLSRAGTTATSADGRRPAESTCHTPAVTSAATSTIESTTVSAPTSIAGSSVVTTRMNDNSSKMLTITVATMLSHIGLTHGPSTSRSLHSNTRNTVALGSRTPASA